LFLLVRWGVFAIAAASSHNCGWTFCLLTQELSGRTLGPPINIHIQQLIIFDLVAQLFWWTQSIPDGAPILRMHGVKGCLALRLEAGVPGGGKKILPLITVIVIQRCVITS